MKWGLILLLAINAPTVSAQTTLEEGAYFVFDLSFDTETDTFSDTLPEGISSACFLITKVDMPGKEIHVALVSGTYHPWRSETVPEPGFVDTDIATSFGFSGNRPNAIWTDLLRTLWKTVPSCQEGCS